jgi:flagellar biosynthesis/type III secretory pathway chaperone
VARFEKPVSKIHNSLQKLVGMHRQLLDVVRAEKDALIEANLRGVQEATSAKQALIENIKNEETARQTHVLELAMILKRPISSLTLLEIAVAVQGEDPKSAEQLRSTFNALTILIKRVTDANQSNSELVNRSLFHIREMKKNVLGDATEKSNTYTQQGTRSAAAGASRLIERKA